jgi:aspartate/methionine/tyrosine aminotransferase
MDSDIEPFHAIEISRMAHSLEAKGSSIIHMEFGQPSFGAPKAAIAAAHKVLESDPMGYWESQPLKERIAQHYKETYDVSVVPDQIILTCGASAALVLALLSAFKPGDRIALARPGYVAYRNTIRALSMVPVEIPCGPETAFQLSREVVDRVHPAPNGLIIASPANPTGTILEKEEMRAIAEVCDQREIHIISDEIYHKLTYEKRAHSILEFTSSALVINSFSKYFGMAGWRLGWLLSPRDKLSRARALVGNLFLSAPSLSQHAAIAALDCHDELDGHVQEYRRNRDLLVEAIPRFGLASISKPGGAFYVYADVSDFTDDSFSFCKRMLEEAGVAAAPGIDFDPVDGIRFIRLSFAISHGQIREAISRLVPWFASLRRNRHGG